MHIMSPLNVCCRSTVEEKGRLAFFNDYNQVNNILCINELHIVVMLCTLHVRSY